MSLQWSSLYPESGRQNLSHGLLHFSSCSFSSCLTELQTHKIFFNFKTPHFEGHLLGEAFLHFPSLGHLLLLHSDTVAHTLLQSACQICNYLVINVLIVLMSFPSIRLYALQGLVPNLLKMAPSGSTTVPGTYYSLIICERKKRREGGMYRYSWRG